MNKSENVDSFVGVGGGQYVIKIMSEIDDTFSVPSRGAAGRYLIDLAGNDEGVRYDIKEGQIFTVSAHLPRFEDTRYLDFPRSELNRVLLDNALRQAESGGCNVRITTGLPVSHYYMPTGKKNRALIDAKIANLRKRGVTCDDLPMTSVVLRKQLLRTCLRSRREVCGMRIGMGCKAQAAANGQGLQRRRLPKSAPAAPTGVRQCARHAQVFQTHRRCVK